MDIFGTSGNDILNGTSGDDLIVLGGGVDTVLADDGNDQIVLEAPLGFGSVIDGGLGFDTLVARSTAGYPSNAGPNTSGYIAGYPTSITGVEALRFESTANSQLYMAILNPVIAGGLINIEGGAGGDILLDLVFAAGTYTMADYVLTNWTNDINDPNFDYVSLYVAPGSTGDFTLIAREGLQSIQSLFAGTGNDTLIGSSGSELLTAGAGYDQLFGNGGADRLFADNLTAYGATPTVRSFTGVFDGGDGSDMLAVGGAVNLTGASLSNLETLSLLDAFAAPFPTGNGRAVASVTLNASQIASGFGAAPLLTGTGSVNLQLASGQSYNASAWQFAAESDIQVNLIGTSGNETITGTSGDDVILPGGGVDTIHAEGGDDEIVLTAQVGAGSILDGGSGYDTLVVRPQSTYPNPAGGFTTQYNAYFPSQIQGLEAVRFESNPGDVTSLVILEFQRAGSGLTTFVGGGGRDLLYDVVFGGGTFTMPEVNFVNWNTNQSDPNSDFFVLFASDANNYVLNAREGLATIQGLTGNEGNDILNGSSGADALDGRGGVNQLYGNGGNDWLFLENRTYFGQPTSTFTFASNIFDGGSGEDLLLVGGLVDFQGTLSNLEGIYFQPSFADAGPGTFGIAPAHLILSASNAYSMPTNTRLGGIGALEINLGTATFLNLSGYQHLPGSNVQVTVNGSTLDDNLRGTTGNDTINGGDGNDFLRGMGGGDTINGGAGNDTIYGAEFSSSAPQPGDAGDTLDGGAGNDLLRGSDGDDTLLGGADDDNLRGDAGNDVIDGGSGNDFVSYLLSDLTTQIFMDLRNLTNSATAQSVADGRGTFDQVSNIERVGMTGAALNDTLFGSITLSNQISGYGGADFIRGGNADDWLSGDDGFGGPDGNDDIRGNGGTDIIIGGAGDDTLVGGFGTGPVQFQAGDLGDSIDGGLGNDVLRGGDGDDTLLGGEGDDNLRGDAGNDTMDGGAGNDFVSYRWDDLTTGMTIDFSAVHGGPDAQQVDDHRGGTDTISNFERIGMFGTQGNDVLIGALDLENQLGGYLGDDTLVGGNLDDRLTGEDGNDEIDGGGGLDTASYVSFVGSTAYGFAADFEITELAPGQWQVTDLNLADGDMGTDVLTNVEQLEFADQVVVLNSTPVAQDLEAATDEDTELEGQLIASDYEQTALTFALVDGPAHGTLTLNPDGTFLYTPDPDYFGSDSFTFTASDGDKTSPAGTVTLTVNPLDNDPTTISGDLGAEMTESALAAGPNGTVSGQLTASDPDGPAAFVIDSRAGTWGSFTIDAAGAWTYELADDDPFIGALNEGDTVTDSFEVTTEDGSFETVTVTIHGVNDAAVIGGNTSGTVTESAALGGISQASGLLTISDVDNPALFVAATLAGAYGTLTLGEDGSWTYLLDNTNPLVDNLSNGQSLSESFTVSAVDGTTQVINLSIAGANDVRTGTALDDVLYGTGGNDSISGSGGNDTLLGGLGADTLNGGAGNDTASYQDLANGVAVSLAIAGAQNTGGGGIDTLSAIENLTGTQQADGLTGDANANVLSGLGGADNLVGNGGNDTLLGGLGDDTLNGGTGIDIASYADIGSGVTVSLALAGAQDTGGGGIDTLIGIESLTGSSHDDVLTGNAGANTLKGGDGNDMLDGNAGTDTLDGGTGTDTASYASAGSAVTVSLAVTSQQNTGGAGSDTLISIENLVGSGLGDRLTGNSAANRIDGGAGADRIVGGGGGDQLFGGLGNDTFAYTALLDSTAANQDTVFDFEGAGILGGDILDLSGIDAIAGGRDNAFSFIGSAAFGNVAGQLRFDNTLQAGVTVIQGDVNGDGLADFQLALQWADNGTTPLSLIAQDFVL